MKLVIFSPILPDAVCKFMEIGPSCGGGWIDSMINALSRHSRDLEILVVCGGVNQCDVKIVNVRYVSFGVQCWKGDGHFSNQYLSKLKALLADFSPDVFHIQGTESVYGVLPEDVFNGKPVLICLQGVISGLHPHFSGGLSPKELWWTKLNLRFLLRGTTIFRTQSEWRDLRAKREETIIKRHHYFAGRTEWDRAWIRYYNPSARYFSINETLRAPFYHSQREVKKKIRHSIFCGGAAGYPLKGVHWLIRAVASLKNEFPDIQLRIAAAGGLASRRTLAQHLKDEAYLMYLRHLIKSLRIGHHIVALPYLSPEQVVDELERAELMVLPSLCENSPNALGEAMLVGTPIISTYAGGIPSIIKNGEEGTLVQSSDPATLSDAIRRAFLNPTKVAAMAEKARMTALARHDGDNNALALIAAYKQMTEEYE